MPREPLDIHASITNDSMSAAVAPSPASTEPRRASGDLFPIHICRLKSGFHTVGYGLEAWNGVDGLDDGVAVEGFRQEEESAITG